MNEPLLNFLFVQSQTECAIDDYLAEVLDGLKDVDKLKVSKGSLVDVLKAYNVPVAQLEMVSGGYALELPDRPAFQRLRDAFSTVEGMTSLATAGWVATFSGDVAMTGEPAAYVVTFMDIGEVESHNSDALTNLDKAMKQAAEFTDEPMPDFKRPDKRKNTKVESLRYFKDTAETHDTVRRSSVDDIDFRINNLEKEIEAIRKDGGVVQPYDPLQIMLGRLLRRRKQVRRRHLQAFSKQWKASPEKGGYDA